MLRTIMTSSLQVLSVDEASKLLSEMGGARHIAIDTKMHRVEFKKDGANDVLSAVIQTDEMCTAEQIAKLATLSLQENTVQRETAFEKFIKYFAVCSAQCIIWMCPRM